MNYTVIVFTIGLIILIHELGHFAAARLAGIPVERFSIGFGPKLYSYRGKDTEYRMSIIPMGGYVLPAVTDTDFFEFSVMRRIVFSLGGPLANIIFSFFLIVIATGTEGSSFSAIFGKSLSLLISQTVAIITAIPLLLTRPENISGIIGIVSHGSEFVGSQSLGIVRFAAFISLNLAVFNLLPIPALDGGKILLFLMEKIHPKLVKLHIPFALAGWALIVILMIYVTVLDVQRLLA